MIFLTKLQKYLYKSLAKTLFVGKRVIFLPSCHSTNDIAIEYTNKGSVTEGTVFITADQTAGKGQRGNHWESQPGANLTFSVIFKPTFLPVVRQFDLNMAISLGILDYLKQYSDAFLVKWPNDIYYADRKISGLLIQNFLNKNTIAHAIAGIGLNINQESFHTEHATSLKLVMGKSFVIEEVLEELLVHVERRYLQLRSGATGSIKEDYLANLYWFGEEHIFSHNEEGFIGKIVGITNEGKLQIETKKGLVAFAMQEVKFLE